MTTLKTISEDSLLSYKAVCILGDETTSTTITTDDLNILLSYYLRAVEKYNDNSSEYPPLPEPALSDDLYSADMMRAYVDADRAMRAQPAVAPASPAASGVDPEHGPMIEFANAGELAFYDYAVAQHCQATLDILDGKDDGKGANSEPWGAVRRRLLELVAKSAAPAAVAGPSEHYDEVRATLTGLHALCENVSAQERRIGPLGSHARGYTWKITAALRHLDALAAQAAPAAQGDAEDAARYRWLRSKSQVVHNRTWLGSMSARRHDVDFLLRDDALAELDAAIDAARSQQKSNKDE